MWLKISAYSDLSPTGVCSPTNLRLVTLHLFHRLLLLLLIVLRLLLLLLFLRLRQFLLLLLLLLVFILRLQP